MDHLIAKFRAKLRITPDKFIRDFIDEIDWRNRFIGIKGARGVGKTTLLLQYAKTRGGDLNSMLYVSLDDLYFRRQTLYELATRFVQAGGNMLLLDEVHRYPDWSVELKNLYDDFSNLRIVFTGSSLLELAKSRADLSRRAVLYHLPGLSFREFLTFRQVIELPKRSLSQILEQHTELATEMAGEFRPLAYFPDYLRFGYYPFFLENEDTYLIKLNETINVLLETDLPAVHPISLASIEKIKTLLVVLAESVPFKPNISALAEKIGVTRNSILDFLFYLKEAELLTLLHRDRTGITRLQKPEKIYLAHPNLHFALRPDKVNSGTLRESFFINQVGQQHTIQYTEPADFLVDESFTFEVGGRGKTATQIKGLPEAYLAVDDLEIGAGRKIPLWLFGLLY